MLAQYEIMYTFSFACENELYSRGNKLEVIEAKIGLTICFDLRFSPLYSFYREQFDLVINIANWPSVREGDGLNLFRSLSVGSHSRKSIFCDWR